MAKYFYVYEIAGSPADRMVKMFNTESVIDDKKSTYIAEKKVAYKDLQGFTSGIKAVGFQLNPELANADIAEQCYSDWNVPQAVLHISSPSLQNGYEVLLPQALQDPASHHT